MRLRMNPRLGEPAEGNLSFMFSQEWLGFATDEEKIFSKKILDFVTKGKALASWMLMLMLVVRQGKYRRRANSLLAFKSYDVHHYIADQALDRKPIQSYFSILHGIVGDFPSLIVDIAAVDIPELTKAVESVD